MLRDYFVAPTATFTELFPNGQKNGNAAEQLQEIFTDVSINNDVWIENRFKMLRRDQRDWSIDGFLVESREGRIVSGPWSTYTEYGLGRPAPYTIEELIDLMKVDRTLYLPIAPVRDSALFWFSQDETQVVKALKRGNIEPEIEKYNIAEPVASNLADTIWTTRVKNGQIGAKGWAASGVVLGRIAFWQGDNPSLHRDRYIKRVYIDHVPKYPLIPKRGVVSSFTEGHVVKSGGIPMDEKYPVIVLRPPERFVSADFIAAALDAAKDYYSQDQDVPIVLRYNTYRPWQGNFPQHGGS